MDFKERLREELDFQDMTVKELAARTGLIKGSIDNYLGKRQSIPPADVALKIAKALNVSVEYLITGKIPSKIEQYTNEQYKNFLKEAKKLSKEGWQQIEPFLLAIVREQFCIEQEK